MELPFEDIAIECSGCVRPRLVVLLRAIIICAKLTSLDVGREHVDPTRSAIFGWSPFICHVVSLNCSMKCEQWGERQPEDLLERRSDARRIYGIRRNRAVLFPNIRKDFVPDTIDPFSLKLLRFYWSEPYCCLGCLAPLLGM